jgi:sugar phosphate isomerase/epimerase
MPPYSYLANGRHHVCNWDTLVDGLKEIGYRGTLAFETFRVFSAYPADVRPDVLKMISSIGRSWSNRITGEEK